MFGWIYRAKRFFEVHGIGERDQLQVVVICLEGATLSWYWWSHNQNPFHSWEDLKEQLLERFHPS